MMTMNSTSMHIPEIPFWPDLKARNRQPELMDDPQLDSQMHREALQGLARINRVTRVYRLLWKAIQACCRDHHLDSLSVTDLGCGSGDLLIWLKTKAITKGIDLKITGCDFNAVAIQAAQNRAEQSNLAAEFVQMDVLEEPLPASQDMIVSSLFLHHLADEDVVRLLQRMAESTRHRVVVQDLVRSRFGYLLCWLGTRLLSRSPVVQTDGPLSVAGAFTLTEIRQLADRATLTHCQIDRHWPERFLLTWRQP